MVSPRAKRMVSSPMRTFWATRLARCISMRDFDGLKNASCWKRSRSKSAASSRLIRRSRLRLKSPVPQARQAGLEPGRLAVEEFGGEVDRPIGGERRRGAQHDARLHGRAAAELDQGGAARDQPRDLAGARLEDAELGAGRIVFGLGGD